MATKPGKLWTYNGGATATIAKLIANGTGMTIEAYAREKLFKPLGIERWEWLGSSGIPSAASGLRLTARDLAKIGRMLLAGGAYDGRSIVPRPWLDLLFTPRINLEGVRYGYFWWLADAVEPRAWVSGLGNRLPDAGEWPAWVAGVGNGGQRLQVQRDIGLVFVAFAGNYNHPQAWEIAVRILEDQAAGDLKRLGK